MSESRLVYYSFAVGRRSLERQFAHSVASLRRHNPTIAVHLFVYNEPPEGVLVAARQHRVAVHTLGDWRSYLRALSPHGATLALLPTLHKVLSLAHLPAGRDDRVLYVDCDTYFFADVGPLFDTYRECDIYAREEPATRRNGQADPHHVDEAALEDLFRREALSPVIPFNTGVMLFNRGIWGDINRARDRFLDVCWRLMLEAFQRPLRDEHAAPELKAAMLEAIATTGPGGALTYPSEYFWLMDEMALWLTLGGINGLKQGLFGRADVMQGGEFAHTPTGTLAHYFSSNEASFFAWADAHPEPARSAEGGRPPARVVDDSWRAWVAENLLLDADPEEVLRVMVANDLDEGEAAAEVGRVQASPYIRGAGRLRNRLRKREWLLAAYRKLDRLRPGSAVVERRHRPGRDEFFGVYYCGNRPVVITGMMGEWPALRKWRLDYFADRFGDREVEIQFGHEDGGEDAAETTFVRVMPLVEFVALVRSAGVTNDVVLTAPDGSSNQRALVELWEDVVQVPEYLDGRGRQVGSFGLHPRGTMTPFRHDLTNSLLAQVLGRKRVLLAPSWDMPLMGNHYHVFSSLEGRATPPSPGAGFVERRVLECVVGPGEMLFLPVGWTYSTEDLEVSAAMSFTNFLYDNDFHSFYTSHDKL